jgi:Flp pilus assembly protein TadB
MRGDRSESIPMLGPASALLAIGCCAGLPLLGSILGGLTIAAVIGAGGGIALVAVVVAAVALLIRVVRRRAYASRNKDVLQ